MNTQMTQIMLTNSSGNWRSTSSWRMPASVGQMLSRTP